MSFQPVENMIEAAFGENGFLAAKNPGYRPRKGQMRLANGVDKTLAAVSLGLLKEDSKSLFVEGPTGVGKSLAYIVPLSYHCARTNERGLIVTGNNNLLHQIVSKDLPSVKEAVPWQFSFAQLKGLNNYACESKWESVQHPYHEAQGRFSRELRDLKHWVESTKTGDKNELEVEPVPELWGHVSTASDGCLGKQCRFKETCFGFAAKARAHNSQIVVTNYHMLFIDLRTRLRSMGERRVLPPYRYLVMDEVHKSADIARDFFSRTASRSEIWRISNALKKMAESESKDLERAANDFFDRAGAYAILDAKGKEKRNNEQASRRIKEADLVQLDHKDLIHQVTRARKRVEIESERIEDEDERLQARRLGYRLESFENDIKEIVGLSDKHAVSYIERSGKGKNVIIGSKPATVSAFLGMGLFGKVVAKDEEDQSLPGPDDADDESGWVEGGEPQSGESRSDGEPQSGELRSVPESDPMFSETPKQGQLPYQQTVLPDDADETEVAEIDELEGGSPLAPTEEEKTKAALIARVRQVFGGRGIICTSATLATPRAAIGYEMFDGTIPDPFEFVVREMGVSGHRSLIVDSPFDFRRQALLVIPVMPPPERKEYARYQTAMGRALVETVKQASGRTLGLFTSWKDLEIGVDSLRTSRLPYRILVQGESPNPTLIRQFREDVHSVLLGTESFFSGIDVQGEALSCVFISKLPFPNPQDPVVEALGDDKASFGFFTIPRTVIVLKQMFGRLIRTTSDRGVVVIADSRLLPEKKGGRSYGKRIVDALPKARRSMELSDIGKFLAGEKVGSIRKEWVQPEEAAELL